MSLPPESFFEGTPLHVRSYIEQLHATIADLHKRMAELESKHAEKANFSTGCANLCTESIRCEIVWVPGGYRALQRRLIPIMSQVEIFGGLPTMRPHLIHGGGCPSDKRRG